MDATVASLADEAVSLLKQQLSQPQQPCVATASIVLGLLQDRLFQQNAEPLQATTVAASLHRFQELFVTPAAAKLAKCKQPQDKVVAIAKFLRGKLAKAPAHKQPLHTQYLPSALKDSGKRQLDCLGIATAVLAMCHQAAAQWPLQHAELSGTQMVVSDDHCWLALPASQATAATPPPEAAAGAAPASQQQQELVYVEVTDPAVLVASQMAGSWLYAGGHGMLCSSSQVLMVLVAGLMPEELQDEAASQQLRDVQLQLLQKLSAAHPEAVFYSNYFRWGMAHEVGELQRLAAAAEAAGASGNIGQLAFLAMLPEAQLQSQQLYRTSLQRSSGWQWHPGSCAAFGWLNRMQAALCGETDDLLCLAAPRQHPAGHAKPWLDAAVFLLQQALAAVEGCTAVLRCYSGCAGKPNKAADTQLMEAVEDLWQNLADASKAIAYLQQLHAYQRSAGHNQEQQQQVPGSDEAVLQQPQLQATAGADQQPLATHTQPQQQELQAALQQGDSSSPGSGHPGSHVPAAAAAGAHMVHLAAALKKAAGSQQHSNAPHIVLTGVLSEGGMLRPQLEFLDALLCFFGEESADVPAGVVADFVTVAGTYTSSARTQAVEAAVKQSAVCSSRVQGLLGSTAWADMEPELQQMLQMPQSRSRKRQRKE